MQRPVFYTPLYYDTLQYNLVNSNELKKMLADSMAVVLFGTLIAFL